MNKLVGLVGNKHVGKSLISTHLKNTHGFTELAFASPLKIQLSDWFCLPIDNFHDQVKKEKTDDDLGVSPRRLMQVLGNLIRDELPKKLPELNMGRKSLWTWIMERRVQEIQEMKKGSKIVISDVRFLEELEFIRSRGGVLIYIDRYDEITNDALERDVSERAERLKEMCDVIIMNKDITPDELFREADIAIESNK